MNIGKDDGSHPDYEYLSRDELGCHDIVCSCVNYGPMHDGHLETCTNYS